MSDDQPFVVCPKCLFEAALKAGGDGAPPAGEDPAPPGGFPAIPGLASRRDFFQKYELLEKMQTGGQGDIWKTWDFEFRRCVAMKRLAARALSVPAAVYRFVAEAQITSQLDHPGILPIFDIGLDPDGRPFYTTQLLPGTTFEDVWRKVHESSRSSSSLNRALELLLRVCDVMAHAHHCGVIHRDLKPSNILVGAFADVRVIDWGSAHVLDSARKDFEESFVPFNGLPIETDRSAAMEADPALSELTASSGLPVTLLFTPPELLDGNLDRLGPRTDIYALGVMLYELLTGRRPYFAAGEKAPGFEFVKQQILSGPPPSVRALDPSISRDLAAICGKAMAYSDADRYPSMESLAADIRAVLEVRPVGARQPGLLLTLQKWALRNTSHLLLAGLGLVLVAIALSAAETFKVKWAAARRIEVLRAAELNARDGRWREALRGWLSADAAGYADSVYLGLRESEAWTILSEPAKSEALLKRLAARPDLGDKRGPVLLRLGEHELFNHAGATRGVQLVREALAAGLTNADYAFAQGLLADTTPEALEFFRQALRYDPYYHSAHRHSLSIEFLSGRQAEFSNHVAIFKILYPDDVSPRFVEAASFALQGRNSEMESVIEALRSDITSNAWSQLNLACRAYAEAADNFDLDKFLADEARGTFRFARLHDNPFAPGVLLLPSGLAGADDLTANVRLPRLPCLQKGVLDSIDALRSMLIPFLGNPVLAVKQLDSGWHHHPEALMPLLAGLLMESRSSADASVPSANLSLQAQFYQRAADSPSMIPQIPRLARYLAARADFALANSTRTNASARADCLRNARQAMGSAQASAAEYQAYFKFVMALGDTDLARELVTRWEGRFPGDGAVRRSRIQVELDSGAFGPALKLINQMLSENPADAWLRNEREAALVGLKNLNASMSISPTADLSRQNLQSP